MEDRAMQRPDGRMLYGYRLSDSEYQSLRETLSLSVQFGKLDEVVKRIRGFSPLFVLYASEWWRREYTGGAWRWEPIIESFGGNSDDLAANTRTDCVVRGFSYWNHRPGGAGKKYFGAIVAHGGLPLKAIGKKSGKVSAVMSHTLRLAARYRWDEAQMADAVAERSGEFPASLRRVEIYELIARMVANVLDLKHEYGLEGDGDPLATLNSKDPEWRQRFPLPLDDEPAQVLLAGLVREASQQVAITSTDIFVVERTLAKSGDGCFELQSSMRCPAMVETEALCGFLREKELPRYFSIDVQLLDRQPLIDARQVLGAEAATISFAARKHIWRGAKACHDHSIHVRDVSGDLLDSALAIPGGEELSLEEPWVFVSRDGKNRFIASGGARIPEGEAFVVLSDGWQANPLSSDSLIESVGQCQIDEEQLYVHRVSGEAILEKNGQQYRIKTKQATGDPGHYVWEGRRLGYSSVPQRVFIGPPGLYLYSDDGDRVRVSARNLAWFVAGTELPIENANLAQGPVDVYLMEGDERVTRFRFVVLPVSAYIDFQSGETASEGEVVFSGWSYSDVAMLTSSVQSRNSTSGSEQSVLLRAADIPPESVTITMRWARGSQELVLRLPFPSVGGHFFDNEGRLMGSGEAIPMSKLLGGRLRIFDRNPQAGGHYALLMTLITSQKNSSSAEKLTIDKKIPELEKGIGEVRLIDLQREIEILMGYSDDVDAKVEIVLKVGGNARASIRVTRYEFSLERSPGGFCFSAADIERMEHSVLEGVVLMACPLAHIGEEPKEIMQESSQCVPVGSWQLESLDSDKSPWLIYPSESSAIYFRPAIWGGQVEDDSELHNQYETIDLKEAIAIPDSYFRVPAMESVLVDMAKDFYHPSWDLIDHVWSLFHHLPLSSIDIWRIVARTPCVAAAVLFRSQLAEDEMSSLACRLRDELGLVWELISIEEWRGCIDLFWQYWAGMLGEDDAKASFPILLKAKLERLSTDIPPLRLMFEMILYEKSGQLGKEFKTLVRAMSSNPKPRVNRLWGGADAMVQTLLFRVHNPEIEQWPEPRLLNDAITELAEKCDGKLQGKIAQESGFLFWELSSSDFKRTVANIPVLCALWAITDTDASWWQKPNIRISLRKVRSFDPIWFELAFKEGLAACLSLGVATPNSANEVGTA